MFAFINREYQGYITDLSILVMVLKYNQKISHCQQQMQYLDEIQIKKSDYALFLEINANYHIKQKNAGKVIPCLSKP